MTGSKRIYALDTNVLLHDPTSLFRFEEHDVFIPMTVLEELDEKKQGVSEVSRNGRQVSRFINELIGRGNENGLNDGLELANPQGVNLQRGAVGRLYFQQRTTNGHGKADNLILAAVIELRDRNPEREVVLVSKDINLRIKAKIYGLHAEDYENDRALDDFALLFTGADELAEDFWDHHPEVQSWNEHGHTFYKLDLHEGEDWYPNQCLFLPGENSVELRVLTVDEQHATLVLLDDHSHPNHSVWGIAARNREQNFALNVLMDPDVDFVTLLGTAGTGKTLLALAAGLAQVMDQQRYREIIMTRATVAVGEDIGFLPGTEEEKMTPWMGALTDNLEVLANPEEGGSWGRQATNDLLASRIKIRSLGFMRGRTFLSRYLIIDEAQNLTPKQLKTLITRAGPGTKIVCLGNVEQIDTPYLTETNSGLTYAVDRFKQWEHSAHITLRRGERSRLADFASEAL
ncbi:PhoH family protein [Rhodanobacter glycinis]|jgi:PhoH-like ATPase|uniref:PhoH family protein n=1 Tax=Rhodanobacter glycinis TaxID=582702 RepID=A0A1I3XRM6_9GAMM|nr:PhoH family protein [Rhodanobacter glycinis]QEE24372.1 PhoH family protein [Rhodanobacter glycinis]TAM16681.1 MAG: PhoH family protein [Rhodanobacter sp.]SFK22184.1 PhoH-like ATPase [Rhodanobacter glycinis]